MVAKFIAVFSGNNSQFGENTKQIFRGMLKSLEDVAVIPRPYQIAILKAWAKRLFCIAPTGAGKSTIMVTRAAQNLQDNITTFIVAPKLSIVECFSQTHNKRFTTKIGKQTLSLAPGYIEHINGEDRTGMIRKALEQVGGRTIPRIIVCCYESFKLAYDQIDKRLLKKDNVEVIVDEAHHVSMNEPGQQSNGLGKLLKQLIADNIAVSAFTATAFRADGGTICNGDIDQFITFRRTLKEHHAEGYCPNLNIHFRFYDEVRADEFKKCVTKSDDILIIGSYKTLLKAYSREHKKGNRTLMILPSVMASPTGGKINAAKVAVELEQKLKHDHPGIRILNLGGFENGGSYQLISTSEAEYKKKRAELQAARDHDNIDIVISIKVMDEGVDWSPCNKVFMPRVPGSLPLIVQRIGRAMRKKRLPSTSDVYFFELGVIGDDPEVTNALVKIAVRLKALFHGLEFNEPFSFGLTKRNILRDKLLKVSGDKLNKANEAVQLTAMKLDGRKSAPELIQATVDAYKKVGIVLIPIEAIEIAMMNDIIKVEKNTNLQQALKSFMRRVSSKSTDFADFFSNLKVTKALESLMVHGPRTYVELLNGTNNKDIERTIAEWQCREISFYPTYHEARQAVIDLGIKSCTEYDKRYKEDPRLRCFPHKVYEGKGWTNWYGYFGLPTPSLYASYTEARQAVINLKIKSQTEYTKRYKEDPRLPSTPHVFYKGKGWTIWRNFTGSGAKKYSTYNEARQAVIELDIKSCAEYGKRYKEDPRLRYSPHEIYKNGGWQGWPHFLGKVA